MAKTNKFVVLHPVRHDGRLHGRGAVLDLGEKDSLRLLDEGVIRAADVVVLQEAVPMVFAPGTLSKLTIPELSNYARTHNLTLREGLSKEEILSEIAQAATAAVQVSQAEAAADGR